MDHSLLTSISVLPNRDILKASAVSRLGLLLLYTLRTFPLRRRFPIWKALFSVYSFSFSCPTLVPVVFKTSLDISIFSIPVISVTLRVVTTKGKYLLAIELEFSN